MSVEPADIVIPFLLGLVLAAGYMAALWGSVRAVAQSGRSLAWLLVGSVMRIAVLLVLFYLIMDGHWERLLACLAGFVMVRFAVTRWASSGSAAGPTR